MEGTDLSSHEKYRYSFKEGNLINFYRTLAST
jgi:hypothetical protein